jgi:hypothetical protein
MIFKDPAWLLNSTPRLVQIEALRRSFGGFTLYENKNSVPSLRQFRSGPARGWNHYLEMRLGKTPLLLNEFELLKNEARVCRTIVFCPNSFKQGWVDEAAQSGASVPWMTWESGSHEAAHTFAMQSKGEFGIAINYEALKSANCQKFLERWADEWCLLVNDESIKIKDHQALQTKAVLLIARNAGFVRNLSGLPMTQGPHDLYPQLRAIRQLSGMNFYAYRNLYCKMGGFKNKKVVGAKDPIKLGQLLATCSFIAKRKDWSEPTVPEYYIEQLPMTVAQKRHYDEMDKDMLTILESGQEISVDLVLTKLMKLQQISSGFIYCGQGLAEYIQPPNTTPKMTKLLDMMEETANKVIVVYNYKESGDALLTCLKKWNPAIIRGAEWMKQHNRNVDTEKKTFNNNQSCRVMILQTVSGKYGHDLSGTMGNRCGTMVFYENTYSLDDRTQVEARNTAAFQDWTNTYHDFVCSKVEKNAVAALERKENVVASVIGSYRTKTNEKDGALQPIDMRALVW